MDGAGGHDRRVVGGVWSCFDSRTCDFVIRHNGRDIFGGLPDGQVGTPDD